MCFDREVLLTFVETFPLEKYLWCAGWSFLGLGAIALRSSKRHHSGKAVKIYLFQYLPALLLVSLAVLGGLQAREWQSGYIFFSLAAPVSYALGYSIDQVLDKVFQSPLSVTLDKR